MAGKSIRELVIKVKQQNAIKVAKDIDRISESLLEATEYAELFNKTLEESANTKGFSQLTASFKRMESSLEEIAKQTRYTTNSIGSLRAEAIEISDAYQQSFTVISEGLDDIASDALRTGKKTEAAIGGVEKATKKNTKATDGSTAAQKRLGNAMKDTTRQGTNQARTFSKMAQQAGGIASAYAIVAANVFALSEAFRIMNEAAAVERLEEVSTVISAGIGVSIAGTAQAMRDATDNAISYQAALRQAAAATAYGFDTEQISEFTQVARRAAVVLGVEMTDALNRVIRGISKAEVELLDELGVTVRLNEAFARYAAEHNIAANSLNSFQRQQALANEVILKSAQNLGAADRALESTSWERFGANVSSATNSMLRAISTSETLTKTLEGLNRVFESFVFDSRASATETAFTKTLEDADGALESIVAYNNLEKERNRLLKETKKTEQEMQALRDKGALGGAKGAAQGLFSSAEIRTANDELDLLGDKMAALENETKLSNDALASFAASLGVSADEVTLMSDSIQNLSLLSRSLGSDLTSFNNDVMGKDSNPYRGLSSSIREAEKDIKKLTDANLALEDALSKLKISEDQYNQFGNIKGYIALLDEQLEKQFEIKQVADAHGDSVDGQLYQAKQELVLLQQRNQYQQAAAGVSELTLEQRKAEYEQTQKIVKLEERRQANSYRNLKAQYALSKEIRDAQSPGGTAVTGALKELELQEEILRVMREQNAEAVKKGNAPIYGADQINAQNSAAASAANSVDATTGQQALGMQQQAAGIAGSLNSGLGETADSVLGLADAWEQMGAAAEGSAARAQAAQMGMASSLQAIGGLVSASAGAAASAIDLEIAALENSGLTQEEQEQKTKELNKKKIKEQEKYAKASILISTAQGIMLAFATAGNIYAGIALAAVTAAAGAMAYQQASNSASSQLASLESSTGASTPTSLTVGDPGGNEFDVSEGASQAERAQTLGDQGVYGRASYGNMHAGKTYMAGEHGKELITPKEDSKVSRPDESTTMGGGGNRTTIFRIEALDAQSFVDRMPELGPAMEEYYEQQGQKLIDN